jgi:hypothetical protein
MSSKTRKEIEQLVEALDDVPITDEEARRVTTSLGIDVKAWAGDIQARVAAAQDAALANRVAEARVEYQRESRRLEARKAGPSDPVVQQQVLRDLLARVPADQQATLNWHKFQEATPEEVAELIRSLRHLLGDDDDEA